MVVFIVIAVALARSCDTTPRVIITDDVIHDTIKLDSIVHDTIWRDSIRTIRIPVESLSFDAEDSVYIAIAEVKHYRDSLYEAWVSGVEANLDSIRIFRKTTVRTITKEVPVYRMTSPTLKPEPMVKFGGFVSASSAFNMNHINAQGGLELAIKSMSLKAGYNVGEYNYPFVSLEYKIR